MFAAAKKVRYVITSASCFAFKDEKDVVHEYTDLTVYHQRKGPKIYKEKMHLESFSIHPKFDHSHSDSGYDIGIGIVGKGVRTGNTDDFSTKKAAVDFF